jgi:predicted RND superfamily exporter protein
MPLRRPRATLAAAVIFTLLCIAGAARLRSDTSLDAMFPEHDPAAASMVRVMSRFGAADELLVLVALPDSDSQPDPDRLLAYAERLKKSIGDGPPLAEAVIYRTEPDAQRFVQEQLAPAALFYLSDAELAAARERLSPRGMREQLVRDKAMMAQPGPAAAAMAQAAMQDPLALRDFLLPQLKDSQPFKTYQNSDALISPDGRALLIRVLGKRPPTDLDYSQQLTGAVTAAIAAASPGGLKVSLGGAYAIAATSKRAIQRDSIESVISSVAMLLALFVLVYRRPIGFFILAFSPVAVGTLWGFGLYGWTLQSLSPIAAVIGGVLAGMGIDYSVLYLTRYSTLRRGGASAVEAGQKTIAEIGTALIAAWVTSVAGFLAIGGSSVKALRDFSILGTLGLGGSFLAALFVLPAVLVLSPGLVKPANNVFRFTMSGLMRWTQRRRVPLFIASGVIAAAALITVAVPGAGIFQAETNLGVMHPQPNPALETEAEIQRRFGVSAGTILIDLRASDDAQLVSLAHAVADRLASPQVREAGIAGDYGLATWLADPAVVAARSKEMTAQDADKVVADFKEALAETGFNFQPFQGYAKFLHELLTRRTAPDIATLRQYPSLSRDLLPRDQAGSAEAVTVVFLNVSDENRDARDAAINAVRSALTGLDGATLTGLPVIGHDAEAAVWSELPRLLWIAAGLVVGYLLIHFRGVKNMALSLLPAAFSFAVLAAVMRLADLRLNMINLVALPLLIGIDVDYGIYLVSLARRGKLTQSRDDPVASGAHAVLVCATSMFAGYASLEFTSIPAVRSLGVIVAIGVVSCLAAALFVLCPLLRRSGIND